MSLSLDPYHNLSTPHRGDMTISVVRVLTQVLLFFSLHQNDLSVDPETGSLGEYISTRCVRGGSWVTGFRL